MLIIEDIIINYGKNEPSEIINDVHIENGLIKIIDPKEQLKNLEETIDGSPKELYEQANINN
jgi:hypothetical protein|tara:strand:+ start:1835 stop:2020 length:186 start_codon:yes stop_codon:yes gene_type:complete